MTLNQTDNLKKKFDKLYDELIIVREESDTIEQCKMLKKIFGDDFEVPEKKEESKIQKNFVPSTSASGR